MIKRRQRVARKISFRTDDSPHWQKYTVFEKELIPGAIEYDKEIVSKWKTYGKDGLDVMGQLRPPSDAPKIPYKNYYNSAKEAEKVYEYDRHYNKPFIPDLKVARDRIKPWRDILKDITKEESDRAIKMSINRTYNHEPRLTDSYLEPKFKHALFVAKFKYRDRTGVFPQVDKYRTMGSYTENTPTDTYFSSNHLSRFGC